MSSDRDEILCRIEDSFDVPRAKIRNALRHLGRAEEIEETFISGKPYQNVTHRHISEKWKYHAIKFAADVPEEFTTAVSDVLHNLRTSWDALIASLVVLNGRKPNRTDAFPVADSSEEYFKKYIQKRLANISEGSRQYINNLKPYKAGHAMLYTVNDLSNRDKHRGMFIPTAIGEGTLAISGLECNESCHPLKVDWHDQTSSLVFARSLQVYDVEISATISSSIAFGMPRNMLGIPVIPLLWATCCESLFIFRDLAELELERLRALEC